MTAQEYRLVELFCGPGGIAKAATLVDEEFGTIKPIWANDIDEDACATYRENIHKNSQSDTYEVIHKDVREFNSLKSAIPQEFEALTFGFPCNDYTVVGQDRIPEEEERHAGKGLFR